MKVPANLSLLLHTNAATATIDTLNAIKEALVQADHAYYVASAPVITDAEYDKLYHLLLAIEELHPEWQTPDSPSQRIAKGLSERFPAVAHLVPMLSLENTYNAADLTEWDRKCREFALGQAITYTVEPKYDGASLSVVYRQNHLERGATRGDGIQGEDVTLNAKQIKSIPLSVPLSQAGIDQMELRGEIVIPKAFFEKYNAERIANGQPTLANPRNAASGTLRILDPSEIRKRGLTAVFYHISYYTTQPGAQAPPSLHTHSGTLAWLHNLGFPTPHLQIKIFDNINDVITCCEAYEQQRDSLPYEIDGLVIKVNSIAQQDLMGMTSHHPRWAVAYKFKARQATSRLLNVEFQVGRTGAITPVAKIEPVPIGGVMVGSVSLFNEDVIKEKDIQINDKVIVERAGDVIPYIVRSITEERTGNEQPIVFPTHCPICGTQAERQPDEAALRCPNYECPVQVVERMIHYASKDALDIRSMGAANVQKFYEQGIITTIDSFYAIDWEKVKVLPGYGEKSVTNLRQAIEQSKTQPLNRLIYGLGIRYVGETTAKTLAAAISRLQDLYEWDAEKLCTLEDVGPKVASAVASFFSHPGNRAMIARLEQAGVSMINQLKADTGSGDKDSPLAGKTFLFTGTLSRMKRSEAEAIVEAKGGALLSGVSSKLNYLVAGEDAGSKLEKAKKLGTVSILTEEEFLSLVGGYK